jgi:invasion protein IalB
VKTNRIDLVKTCYAGAIAVLIGVFCGGTVLAQTDAPPQQQAPAFGPRTQKPQRAQKRGPPPEIVATFDDWKIQCETVQVRAQQQGGGEAEATAAAASSGKTDNAAAAAATPQTRRFCGMVQSARNDKRPQIGLTLYISRIKQGDKMQTQLRVMAPIGVFLPTGVGLEIDGVAVSRVPLSNCLPQICLARAEASPETLDKLRKGNIANFIIWEGPGAGMPMKISLKGFGKALEALDQL